MAKAVSPGDEAEQLRLLLEGVRDYAIFMLDLDGYIVSWNSGAERLKGYSADEAIGQHFSIFYPEADRKADKPERILQTVRREGRYEEEGWRVRKDGSRFWANVTINALYGSDGLPRGFAKITRDMTERKEAEDALHRTEERLRLLVESIQDYAIFMLSPDGTIVSWNLGAQRVLGYAEEEVLGRNFSIFFPPEDVGAGKPLLEMEAAIAEGRYEEEGWRLKKDGSRFWASVAIAPMRDRDGTLIGFAKVTRDMTERRRAREELQASQQGLRLSERRYRTLVEASTSIVWVADAKAQVTAPQPGWERYTGQVWPDYRGTGFLAMVHPDDREDLTRRWQVALAETETHYSPARVWHAESHSWHHCDTFAVPLKSESGEVLEWVGTTHDVEERHELAERELERVKLAARVDELTDLGNRRAFQEDLQLEVARSTRRESFLTLAVIEVHDFEPINDSHAYARRDEALSETGRLLTFLAGINRAYRIGVDEFALILVETQELAALSLLDRVRIAIAQAMEGVSVSIGSCTSEGGQIAADVMLENAEFALNEAKHHGRSEVVSYNPSFSVSADLTQTKVQAVDQVISSGAPELWFQPILHPVSKDLLAFEALLRPSGLPELAGPEETFEIARRLGRTRELDLACAARALNVARSLPSGVKIFINLDPATLMDPEFSAGDLVKLAEERDVDQRTVVFEVTEKTSLPLPRLTEQVRSLQDRGFAVALDDVGTGNSGLEMLRLVDFDYLKIARGVILDAVGGGAGRAVILAITAFARETGALVIAEGIENEAMLEVVQPGSPQRFSIDAVQGYLFGRPEPSVERYLEQASAKRP